MKIKQATAEDTNIDVTQILDNWDAEVKEMLEEMWDEDDEMLKGMLDALDNEREENELIKKLLAELEKKIY